MQTRKFDPSYDSSEALMPLLLKQGFRLSLH